LVDSTRALIEGNCVVIPTETVYGLAANALNSTAVSKIFKIKKRPKINPLIVHFNSLVQLNEYVDLSDEAMILAQNFWPGPMTLIVQRRHKCKFPDIVTAGLSTIAVRIPSHPVAQKIIAAADIPLAAPSANLSGEPSPTNALDVAASLGDSAPLIIADGSAQIGLESTVIDVSHDHAVILRPGAITIEDVSNILDYTVQYDDGKSCLEKPKSPGQLLKHYAPNTQMRLRAIDVKNGESLFMNTHDIDQNHILNLSETGDLEEAAHNLFNYIRRLDKMGTNCIAVMDVPYNGIGVAINERISRAASS
jgi:L-threonylcarbamoyladenylate synthase